MLIGKKQEKPVLVSEEYHAEYRIENNEAEFVKYIGTDDEYEVPAVIDGCPVTRIGRYAFAERRNLLFVKLPISIRIIGPHSFYNCRSLERLEFGDKLVDIEDGAFKNCTSFKHMIYRTTSNARMTIKNILMDTADEVRVTIYFDDKEENNRAELIFPPYYVEYEENTPGRVFNRQAHGSGERYRNCMYDGLLNLEQFDHLLDYSVAMDQMEYPIQNAVSRLMYPYQLKEEHRVHYEKFVTDYLIEILSFYIKKEDVETLKWMIDEKRLNKEDLNTAMTIARTSGKNGLLPMFMEYQNVNFKPKKKSFDL